MQVLYALCNYNCYNKLFMENCTSTRRIGIVVNCHISWLVHFPLGSPQISSPLQFSADNKAGVIKFNLTCISYNGPAQIVTWTRDGAAATGVTSQTVVDQWAITYHSTLTLTVTGRLAGTYQCSVGNDQGQATSQLLDVKGVNVVGGVKHAHLYVYLTMHV